jgi:two-component system response regulator
LIIEDSQDDKDLILRAFRKAKVFPEITLLKDGAEALDYRDCIGAYEGRDPYDLPDIILLDLKLPKVDGKEVLAAFKADELFRMIPTIILSSSGEKRDVNECYRLGANSYIKKPIDFVRFLEIINCLIAYWLNINESVKM